LAIPVYARAHEGHKVMGTVVTLHESHLAVRATDGKSSTITLNERPNSCVGRRRQGPRPGERVFVTATETKGKDGKTTMIATEIRLPEAGASK
jgi:hypothetical protein